MESLQKLLLDERESLGDTEDYRRRKARLQSKELDPSSLDVNAENVHQEPLWRYLIVQWCYEVADVIEADREIVYIAIHILDRYIAKMQQNNRPSKKHYEIMVMSSFLLAMRLYSSENLPLTLQALLEKSSSSISSSELLSTAKDIYTSLTWHATVPTAARFVHALVQTLPDSISQDEKTNIFDDAVFQVELSVFDEFLMNYPLPSFVAWMVLENTLCDRKVLSASDHNRFREEISSLTGYREIFSIRSRLQNLQSLHASGTDCPCITHIIPVDEDTSSDLVSRLQITSPLQIIQEDQGKPNSKSTSGGR